MDDGAIRVPEGPEIDEISSDVRRTEELHADILDDR